MAFMLLMFTTRRGASATVTAAESGCREVQHRLGDVFGVEGRGDVLGRLFSMGNRSGDIVGLVS